jgi:hypothetical protein
MIRRNDKIYFAQANIYGAMPNKGDEVCTELFPPRSNKNYTQSPYTAQVIKAIKMLKPHKLTFWGVGFTASDVDLFELYANWSKNADLVEVINPNPNITEEVLRNKNFNMDVEKLQVFCNLDDWIEKDVL